MKINLDAPAEEVQIQLIPLIDVIFCILTFFILAALQLTRQQGLNVDLPRANTAATQMREMLVVSIDSVGQTYIDQNPISESGLYQQLLGYQQTNPTGMIVLYAPKTALYDDVVRVLDLLRSVGGDRVALATLPGDPKQGQPNNPLNPSLPGGQLPGAVPTADPLNPLGVPNSNSAPSFDPNQFQLVPNPGSSLLTPEPQLNNSAPRATSPSSPPNNSTP